VPISQKVNHNEHVPVDIIAPDQKYQYNPPKKEAPQLDRFGGLAPFQHHAFDDDMQGLDG